LYNERLSESNSTVHISRSRFKIGVKTLEQVEKYFWVQIFSARIIPFNPSSSTPFRWHVEKREKKEKREDVGIEHEKICSVVTKRKNITVGTIV
jgi:hypothetical protein